MNDEVQGVVVTHGELGDAMLAAVVEITGTSAGLKALTNRDLTPDTLCERLADFVHAGPAVVFVDLPSGSCALAARRLRLERSDVAVVCGVNLPLLLDFSFHRDRPLSEIVERLREHVGVSIEHHADADRPLQS